MGGGKSGGGGGTLDGSGGGKFLSGGTLSKVGWLIIAIVLKPGIGT